MRKKQIYRDWQLLTLNNLKSKLLPVIFLTPLRAGVILITPLFTWLVSRICTVRSNNGIHWLLVFILFSGLYGILNESNNWANVILAISIEIPVFYLLFADYVKIKEQNYVCFIKASTWVLGIIDLLGFYTFFFYHIKGEDSFGIPYGSHFTSVHGMSLMNAIMFFYYSFNNIYKREWINKIIAGYFFICFVMCFYGLGTLCMGAVLGVYGLSNFKFKKIIGFSLIILIAGYIVLRSNSNNVSYMESKVTQSYSYNNLNEAPRKIRFVARAYDRFCKSPITDNLFGFGPGSYNGRVAFLLNDDAKNPFTEIFGTQMPQFHVADVYIYWSKRWVSMSKYNDGTINKPNSSLVSIIMENGMLFAALFLFLWGRMMFCFFVNRSNKIYMSLFLINLFFFLNFVTEQWLETSEFLFFAVFSGINVAFARSIGSIN